MADHFEELWVKSENFQKDAGKVSDVPILLEELGLKLNLYKAIDSKKELPKEDRQKVKSRLLGEILLTLTGLSFKDDINVYEALNIALQYRSLMHDNKQK
jgi:hypothetical protein